MNFEVVSHFDACAPSLLATVEQLVKKKVLFLDLYTAHTITLIYQLRPLDIAFLTLKIAFDWLDAQSIYTICVVYIVNIYDWLTGEAMKIHTLYANILYIYL